MVNDKWLIRSKKGGGHAQAINHYMNARNRVFTIFYFVFSWVFP